MKPFIAIVFVLLSIQAHSRDLVTNNGTVYPLFAGTVFATGFEPLCSDANLEKTAQVKFISIESNNGVRIKYKGVDLIFVEVGTQVDFNTPIGHIISTSRVRPPIYLEAHRTDGTPIFFPAVCNRR